MNVAGVAAFSRPVPDAKRTDRSAPADDTEAPRRAASSAEFAAFLHLLVGGDPKLRTDLLKQLPAEGASVLDHLLAEGVPADNATDAVRYGMLTNRTAQLDVNDIVAPLVQAPSGQSRISPAVLARLASRKTSAVEELLAIGDRDGALARARLDGLLAKAGTEEGISITAINASNAALTAALAASAADVGTPIRDMEALDPELRARFARVVDRMQSEFGHEVTVVETARSQERQNHLYAQGRTTPGSVVTWTTDSTHTQGEALDVIVDGSWNNPTGFARLQQMAKEEGLGTLGPRDPGHLELPKDAWTNNTDVRVTSSVTSGGNSGIARVATVARMATVASAANAGTAATTPPITQPNTPVNASLGLVALAANSEQSNTSQQGGTNQDALRDRRSDHTRHAYSLSENTLEGNEPRAAARERDKSGTQNASLVVGGTAAQTASFIGPIDEVELSAGATAAAAAERVEGINTMRQQQGSKPLSQITLEVEGPNGSTQVTVDVRGNAVGTHISSDSLSADRMRSNVSELKTGLENRGLESDSVRISSQGVRTLDADQAKTTTGSERDAIRLSGAGASGNSTGNDGATQQQRDRSSAAREWEDRQASREEQRAQHGRSQNDRSQNDRSGQRDGHNPERDGSSSQDAPRPQYQEKR